MNNGLSMLNVLNGLSRTLNFANQMIPLYKQLKPIINNSGKVLNNIKHMSFKNSNNKRNSYINNKTEEIKKEKYYTVSSPTFFQ